MFLEEDVYGMLNWGFGIVMSAQILFFIRLSILKRSDKATLICFLMYIILFTLAGLGLLSAMNTFEYTTGMGSEEASLKIAISGILWGGSVLFLLIAISRLVRRIQ